MEPQQTQTTQPQQPSGFYSPDEQPTNTAHSARPLDSSVEWEASEYVHHSKGASWFISVALVTLAGIGLAVYLQQWLFAVLVVIMGIAFAIFGRRPPRVLHYKLSDTALTIDSKQYSLSDFSAFGVRSEGAFYTAMLLPVKRLSPGLNIYFSEAEGDKIIDILGTHLPVEHMEPDPIDKLMDKLRF